MRSAASAISSYSYAKAQEYCPQQQHKVLLLLLCIDYACCCCCCRYIPFSGGPRKCVGDQFALMEAVVALAVLLKRFNFKLVPGQTINMTTGATIHTTDGLYMTVENRQPVKQQSAAAAAVVA